jgi:hypothetical protein
MITASQKLINGSATLLKFGGFLIAANSFMEKSYEDTV